MTEINLVPLVDSDLPQSAIQSRHSTLAASTSCSVASRMNNSLNPFDGSTISTERYSARKIMII